MEFSSKLFSDGEPWMGRWKSNRRGNKPRLGKTGRARRPSGTAPNQWLAQPHFANAKTKAPMLTNKSVKAPWVAMTTPVVRIAAITSQANNAP